MSFYSYFDWHNCPSPERISLTIKKKPVNGVNVTETKGLKSQKVRVKFKKVAGAKKYQVKIGGKVKTIKKTSYLSKKLKGDKYYGISVRAKVGKQLLLKDAAQAHNEIINGLAKGKMILKIE